MLDTYFSEHWLDNDGNPAGGVSCGKGFTISWQNGPLGSGETRREPNGAFVETIIMAVKDRIQFYQDSKFRCDENANALMALSDALSWLNSRTVDREKREVEGLYKE